jgi:hypothetical protein
VLRQSIGRTRYGCQWYFLLFPGSFN